MSVRNAGATIREAREKAGLTREQLSEGVCSVTSLYRIENGSAGVSPSTFQALMAHAGAPCEIFPIFANRADFDCFFALKHARFHLDSWQLQPAFEELCKIEEMNWADNKFYYQEWLLLHAKLQFCSGTADYTALLSLLDNALHITRPDYDISLIHHLLLSITEIELFLMLAQTYLYMNQTDYCLEICRQMNSYIENSQLSALERDRLMAEYAIVFIKYLIGTKNYSIALNLASKYHEQTVIRAENVSLLELTFLKGLAQYFNNNITSAANYFKMVIFSSHAIGSCYATICTNYLGTLPVCDLWKNIKKLPFIPLPHYTFPSGIHAPLLSDGVFDLYSPDVFSLGVLIRTFRQEQKISQSTLCQGLCSKSALSKIENGTLQPDMMLAEALLQRLGISEREFTFWGDTREARIHELIFKIIRSNDTVYDETLNELSILLLNKDPLLYQFILFQTASLNPSPQDAIKQLQEALAITLPNFDINFIHKYRLSWIELSILNNIAFRYKFTDTPHIGIVYFYYLLEYYKYCKLDIIFLSHTQSVMLSKFVQSLYPEKRYREINDLFFTNSYCILKYSLHFFGPFLFYFCQSLAECSQLVDATLYGAYAYYIECIENRSKNSELLHKALLQDFAIDILS